MSMYQKIHDRELIQSVSDVVRDNLSTVFDSITNKLQVYGISEGVFLASIENHRNQEQGRKILIRLDKMNPLKNTLITVPKAVEIIAAYEFNRNHLGPELLSVFKNGRIEEWINGYSIGNRFKHDKDLRQLVAQCIAKIHLIENVKTEVNNNFLSSKVRIFLKLIYKSKSNENYLNLTHFMNRTLGLLTQPSNTATSTDSKIQTSSNNESIDALKQEFNFLDSNLIKLVEGSTDEIVFSHNDLSQENIYQRIDATNSNQIYVLNYDLCGYNYRGYDIAHCLNNNAFDFSNPPTSVNELNWLTDDETNLFLMDYLIFYNDLNSSKGKPPIDLNKLLKEVKFFRIYSAYLSILVSTLSALSNELFESNLHFLKIRIDIYLKLKSDYLASYSKCGAIDSICSKTLT